MVDDVQAGGYITMKRGLSTFTLSVLLAAGLSGTAAALSSATPSSAAYDLAPWSKLGGSLSGAYAGNILLPGMLQVSLGDSSGYAYMIGGPLAWGGQYLLFDYLNSKNPSGREWERGLGEAASTIGMSTIGYTYLSWERQTTNSRVAPSLRRPDESYLTLLSAPYRSANALRWDTLGLVGFETVASYGPSDWVAMYNYFSQPRVDFFGAKVAPLTGLALVSAFSLSVNLFVAVGEESLFRGFGNDAFGVVPSSILFGLAHLSNGFIYRQEKTDHPWLTAGLQAVFAGIFGFYASYVDAQDGYSLQRSISLHYWNNVAAMILDYLASGGKRAGL